MTQIMDAKKGILTDEMKQVAAKENVSEEFILKSVANGTIVIPSNVNRDIEASGIGAGLRTKVNATVGTSTDIVDFDEEVLKAQIAIDNGADIVIGGHPHVIQGIERYEGKVEEFIQFISNPSFAVDGSYKQTWKFIEKDNNSLKRYTNMHLIFQ